MNRLRFAALLAVLAFLAPAPGAFAAPPTTDVRDLLLAARDPADLRARLAAFAGDSATGALAAAEAWFHLGASRARAGDADGALAAFARARALRGNVEEQLAAVDVHLARRSGADLDSASALLAALLAQPPGGYADELTLRDAWLRATRGDAAALRPVLDPRGSPLLRPFGRVARPALWAGRFAPLALAAGDGDAAWRLVSPLVTATRGGDPALSGLARNASVGRPIGTDFDRWLQLACVRADTTELATLVGLGAKPLEVAAEDGAKLHAWFVAGRPGAPVAVVTAPADGGAAAACDSLLVQLRRAGLAVAMLEPRGVRRSASATEPAALLREGGEEARQRRLASDLGHALTAAARAAGSRSPHGVAVGVSDDVLAAALACEHDTRFRAALLVGPVVAPVDRGWLRGSLAASAVPVFFETAPEAVLENQAVDRIVAQLPAAQARVADSRWPGHGAAVFRAGPAEGVRFAGWLSDALKRPRATPPSPRR